MTGDIFYFLSSQPSLRWGEQAAFSPAEFIKLCEEYFGAKTAARLSLLSLLPSEDKNVKSDVVSAWRDFEAFVRNSVASIRKSKLKRSGLAFTPRETSILSPGYSKRIDEIMSMPSPLERENALDLFRWQFLDSLEAKHYFDYGCLEIYTMKLLLLEKQNSRQLKAGKEAFARLMQAGLDKAQAVRQDDSVQAES